MEHSGSLRASETYAKHEGGMGVFIGPKSSGRPTKGRMSNSSCLAVQRLPHMSRYQLAGISKSSVHLVVPRTSALRFAEHTSSGPSRTSALQTAAYIRQT